ncbi:acyltransferase family protein [Kineococcus sp. G2]|uniref:acyltransferase family protein n=1 Tax=Kineococcus sp. G2 TaxID=3127484 RepID=UPI00301B8352
MSLDTPPRTANTADATAATDPVPGRAADAPVTTGGAVVAPRAARVPGRDRYIDSLRVVALARVVAYHVVGGAWLPVLFPSMGVMFALGGALMASSLDRAAPVHRHVLRRRLRRLLPPLWLYGALVVPVMLLQGWSVDTAAYRGSPLTWSTAFFWVVPLSDPPGSQWGEDWVLPLWYIRTYLWLVLLSPALLWAFRRWPLRTASVPLGLLGAYAAGLWSNTGRVSEAVLSFATFGACWVAGFAHHDGLLRRVPWRVVAPFALLVAAGGIGYALHHAAPGPGGWNIDDIPVADGLYCLGFVLLLLRAYPDFSWMARHRWLDAFVGAVNSRAVTIYLWGNLAIWLAGHATGMTPFTATVSGLRGWGEVQLLLITAVLLTAAVLAFGWAEDVAAGLRPRLLPGSAPRRLTRRPGTAPGTVVVDVRGPAAVSGGRGPAGPR